MPYMNKAIWKLLLLLPLVLACKPEPRTGVPTEPDVKPKDRLLYVGTQGTSPDGISELHQYNITTRALTRNVYRKRNLVQLGSRLTDLYMDKETHSLLALLPQNEFLRIADLSTLALKKTVPDIRLTNQMLRADQNSLYITSDHVDGVYVVSGRWKVREEIPTGINPTAMLKARGKVFIANTGNAATDDSTVTIMDARVDTVMGQMMTNVAPNSMVVDDQGFLYVLCSGKFNAQNPVQSGVGSLHRYHLDSIQRQLDSNDVITPDTVVYFTDNQLRPNDLTLGGQGQLLFYRGNTPGSIYSQPIYDLNLTETPIVNGHFSKILYDTVAQKIMALTIPQNDEEAPGNLEIYTAIGALEQSMIVGIKPTDLVIPPR